MRTIVPKGQRFFKLPNCTFKTASSPSQTMPTVSERSWLSSQCGQGMARAPGIWKMAYGPATVLNIATTADVSDEEWIDVSETAVELLIEGTGQTKENGKRA